MQGGTAADGAAGRAARGCSAPASLAVLQDVQRAYQRRMDTLDQLSGCKKHKMQIELLRGWVSDLAGQNSLLAHTVEELEAEASSRLIMKQIKHSEVVCELREEVAVLRKRLARKDSDLRGLVEVLRRIRDFDYWTLNGIHFFEISESDIFGNGDRPHKKMAQGDLRQDMKHNTEHTKHLRHRRVL